MKKVAYNFNLRIVLIALFCSLSAAHSTTSADNTPARKITKDCFGFYDNIKEKESLSKKEFGILMNGIEAELVRLKTASSKISIEDANFSYKIGKYWEYDLSNMKNKNTQALEAVTYLNKHPDSIFLSTYLYSIMVELKESANAFDNIEGFEKIIGDIPTIIGCWNRAFLNKHLLPLASKKDRSTLKTNADKK